jgi:hypothetical protein
MEYDFTSHFDQENNVCYILVHGGPMMSGKPVNSYLLCDAYEGRQYADYWWMNTDKKKYWEVAPLVCDVKPRNAEESFCHSDEEFASLLRHRAIEGGARSDPATRSLSVDSIWIASESVGFSVGALHCRALQAVQASMSFV